MHSIRKIFLNATFVTMLMGLAPAVSGAAPADLAGAMDQYLGPERISSLLVALIVLTALSFLPAIVMMGTSFLRIVIVLGFMRHALGTQQSPPNQVLIGMALFLTFFVMAPTWEKISESALGPYQQGQMNWKDALSAAAKPLREFLIKQTRKKDLSLMVSLSKSTRPKNIDDVTFTTILPAFILSELKTAFEIGFLIFIPFLVVDMIVASILMSMGMMMVPPITVSLPLKLLVFIMMDGWHLLVVGLVQSFR